MLLSDNRRGVQSTLLPVYHKPLFRIIIIITSSWPFCLFVLLISICLLQKIVQHYKFVNKIIKHFYYFILFYFARNFFLSD